MRTRVFELARERGWSMRTLASAMGISHSEVVRVRLGQRPIGGLFIRGAMLAFPDLTFEQMFTIDREEVPA